MGGGVGKTSLRACTGHGLRIPSVTEACDGSLRRKDDGR